MVPRVSHDVEDEKYRTWIELKALTTTFLWPSGAKWQSAVSKYGKSAVESTIRDHLGLAEETQA